MHEWFKQTRAPPVVATEQAMEPGLEPAGPEPDQEPGEADAVFEARKRLLKARETASSTPCCRPPRASFLGRTTLRLPRGDRVASL